MRFAFRFAIATLAAAWPPLAQAQKPHSITLGANYTYVRTNVLPGCGCYGLNGGGLQAQFGLSRHLAVLADATLTHNGGITPDRYTLTQFTWTGGLRFWPLTPQAKVRPFGEITVGGASTFGTLSPSRSGVGGGGTSALAFQPGGGIAVRLSPRFALVPVQADYLLTTFNNNASDRQNDLRLSAGILIRLSR